MMHSAQVQAIADVADLLRPHIEYEFLDPLVESIVNTVAKHIRIPAEEQVKSSGWISPDELSKIVNRAGEEAVANHCQDLRLALEGAASHIGDGVGKLMTLLAVEESHHRRMAKKEVVK